MIAIALVRGISVGIIGTDNHAWNFFWVEVEASISVITACPIAFRSVFLLSQSSKKSPNRRRGNEGQRPSPGISRGRVNPHLPSINIGATLTGMRTMIGKPQLNLRDDDGYAFSSTATQSHRSSPSPSFEATQRGVEVAEEPLQTMV